MLIFSQVRSERGLEAIWDAKYCTSHERKGARSRLISFFPHQPIRIHSGIPKIAQELSERRLEHDDPVEGLSWRIAPLGMIAFRASDERKGSRSHSGRFDFAQVTSERGLEAILDAYFSPSHE